MLGRVVVAGGTGFIGQHLVRMLKESGYETVILTRSPKDAGEIEWDGKRQGGWISSLKGALAVINLSGASIAKKWTPSQKQRIVRSRVDSSMAIGQAIAGLTEPPKVWLNGSAVGFYGD